MGYPIRVLEETKRPKASNTSQDWFSDERNMTLTSTHLSAACLVGLTAAFPGAGPARADTKSPEKRAAHVTVRVYADRQAVRPGDTLRLAASVTPDEDWHVYWQNPGGMTGLPTEIQWTLPDGFEAGRTRYPAPSVSHDPVLKEDSFILDGQSLFVTPVRVSEAVPPGGEATITAKVSWLACKKECIPGDVEVSLKLPVVSRGEPEKPANRELFEKAEGRFPIPAAKAEHVRVSGRADRGSLKPGDSFNVVVTAQIAAGHHMQSNKPLDEYLIPAVLFVERPAGLEVGAVAYPQARVREDKLLGKLSEYGGRIDFKAPIEIDEDAEPAALPRAVRAVLQSQICNEKGTCFPPQYLEIEIPIDVAGAAKAAAEPNRPNDKTAAAVGGPARPPPSGGEPSAETAADAPVQSISEPSANADLGLFTRFQNWLLGFGYKGALAVAFLGGIILNLMPCVLPVISLKVLSFVRQANEDRGRIFALGLTYSAGIMFFFGAIALLWFLTDQQLGWGSLFQRPHVVIIVAAVVTAFAMSLFGVFAIFTPRVINRLDEKVEGEGYASAFATGILATFLGAACTAPFLSAALGAATRFGSTYGALIFLAAGFGMALPFIVLAANPAWLRFIPKPGPWMGTFEALMGFLLLITVIWLLNPLRGQIGDFGVLLSLFFLLMTCVAVWVKGKIAFNAPLGRKVVLYGLAVACLAVGWLVPFRWMATIDELIETQIEQNELLADGQQFRRLREAGDVIGASLDPGVQRQMQSLSEKLDTILAQQENTQRRVNELCDLVSPVEKLSRSLSEAAGNGGAAVARNLDWTKGIPWQHYRRNDALADVRAGYTVFVDYTADWCVNCKVNKKTSIEHESVVDLMREYNVIPYEADYTLPVKEIQEDLARHQRGGVPLYLVYSPQDPDHPQVLPEILTPGILIDALKKAGPSKLSTEPIAAAGP